MREDGHGFGPAVAVGFFYQPALGWRGAEQEQGGGFNESRTKIGIADFGATGTIGVSG